MTIFTDLEAHMQALRGVVGADAEAESLPGLVSELTDGQVVTVLTETAALMRAVQAVQTVASGVAAARSTRDAGHSGLAQVRGQGSVTALLQDLIGATRADAIKQVRAGEALLNGVAGDGTDAAGDAPGSGTGCTGPDADGTGPTGGAGPGGFDTGLGGADLPAGTDTAGGARTFDDTGSSSDSPSSRRRPWHAPLGQALLHGRITVVQHDAIRRGLGEPPTVDGGGGSLTSDARETARHAWETAAIQLIDEAGCRTVEDLAAQARAIRDALDPDGAARRFDERFQRRSFRTWRDRDGVTHGLIQFDDEGALWVKTIFDAALAPRRGVRFVDAAEKDRAKALSDDPRTNDQLAYDLAIDLLRAGALADAGSVFGTRQAGVRILITEPSVDAAQHGRAATASAQDDTTTLPAWLADQHACDTGTRTCRIDGAGNPLDLGREARLYTAGQKLTLAIRDGGCRWPGCDRRAHYCEAHHIDPWAAGGTTDVDRGILLCRFHHGNLHHGGWRITRSGLGDFVLHPPGTEAPIVLTTHPARQYLFRTAPPPPRFRPRAA